MYKVTSLAGWLNLQKEASMDKFRSVCDKSDNSSTECTTVAQAAAQQR